MKKKLMSFGLAFLLAVGNVAFADDAILAAPPIEATVETPATQTTQTGEEATQNSESAEATAPDSSEVNKEEETQADAAKSDAQKNAEEESTVPGEEKTQGEQAQELDPALLAQALDADAAGKRLSGGVSMIKFIHREGRDIESVRSQGHDAQVYLRVEFDLTGKEVKPGDYIQLDFPKDLVPLLGDESKAIPDSTGTSQNIATFTMDKASNRATLTFTEDVVGREKITGSIQFEGRIYKDQNTGVIFGDRSFTIGTSETESTSPSIKVLPVEGVKTVEITKELLYKGGYSSKKEKKFLFNIRINRIKQDLGTVVIVDTINDKMTQPIEFIKDSFKLYEGDYGHASLDSGNNIAQQNRRALDPSEYQLEFSADGKTFTLTIENVGTKSYYLSYETTHHNDKKDIGNGAKIFSDDVQLIPYEAVISYTDGEVTRRDAFNTNFDNAHYRQMYYAYAVEYVEVKSEEKPAPTPVEPQEPEKPQEPQPQPELQPQPQPQPPADNGGSSSTTAPIQTRIGAAVRPEAEAILDLDVPLAAAEEITDLDVPLGAASDAILSGSAQKGAKVASANKNGVTKIASSDVPRTGAGYQAIGTEFLALAVAALAIGLGFTRKNSSK